MSERLGIRFLVSGRVQGVYFRRSAMAAASELGLVGWVENRRDGRVGGYACGSGAALETFAEWLQRGPAHAHVEHVEFAPAAIEELAAFTIR